MSVTGLTVNAPSLQSPAFGCWFTPEWKKYGYDNKEDWNKLTSKVKQAVRETFKLNQRYFKSQQNKDVRLTHKAFAKNKTNPTP